MCRHLLDYAADQLGNTVCDKVQVRCRLHHLNPIRNLSWPVDGDRKVFSAVKTTVNVSSMLGNQAIRTYLGLINLCGMFSCVFCGNAQNSTEDLPFMTALAPKQKTDIRRTYPVANKPWDALLVSMGGGILYE